MPAVSCAWINDIVWKDVSPDTFILSGEMHVWGVQISSQVHNLDRFTETLHPNELERAHRYYQQKDKDQFIISRGVLRALLGKYSNQSPESFRFDTGMNKKPFLQNAVGKQLYFNVTHSGNWILIAIAHDEAGIDIEKINPDFNYEEILELIFSGQEIQHIRDWDPPSECFYKLWTRKEALAKALGIGLTDDLKAYPSLEGTHDLSMIYPSMNNDWIVSTCKLDESYMVSIAKNPSIPVIRFNAFVS